MVLAQEETCPMSQLLMVQLDLTPGFTRKLSSSVILFYFFMIAFSCLQVIVSVLLSPQNS